MRQTIFPLNERGYRQAQRNNSHSIWSLLSWSESDSSLSQTNEKPLDNTLSSTLPQPLTQTLPLPEPEAEQEQPAFTLTKNQAKDNELQSKSKGKSVQKRGRAQSREVRQPKPMSEMDELKRKSIEKYLKDQVPFSRTLSNSAFRKFYQRPCQQAYGRGSTKQGGVCYGDFMKTHNIQPHTLDNHPQNYQSYTSALNFGKRTKLDLQDRWKRIERQLAKNLDYRQPVEMMAIGEIAVTGDNMVEMLKTNINREGEKNGTLYPERERERKIVKSGSLDKLDTRATLKATGEGLIELSEDKKRAKSSEKPIYYIYRYKDEETGCTRLARDRHGLTCCVDDCFRQNQAAQTEFQKRKGPIFPTKCKPEDMNIDAIRIQNHEKSKDLEKPGHYLLPNVEQPYQPQKYSRKRNISLAATATG